MNEKALLKKLEGFNPLDLKLAKVGCLIKYFYYDQIQKKYTFRLGGFLKEVNHENNYLLLGDITNKVSWKLYMHELPDRVAPVIYYKNTSINETDNSQLNKTRNESRENLSQLLENIKKIREHINSS